MSEPGRWRRAAAVADVIPAALAAAVALVAIAGPARAGGIRDLEDGWLLPADLLWEALAPAGAPGADPARGGGGWVRCGVSRLHGLAELPLLELAAGQERGRLLVAGSWQRLGEGLYREQRWRLRLGLAGRRRWWLGLGQDRLALGDAASLKAAAAEAGGELRGDGWRASLRWPLLPAPAWYGEGGVRPWLAAAARTGGGGLVAVALDRRAAGVPVLELEAGFRLAAGTALGLRAEPSTGALGPTLALRRGHLLLRSSHLVHPALGPTHRWSLAWGRPGASR